MYQDRISVLFRIDQQFGVKIFQHISGLRDEPKTCYRSDKLKLKISCL
jgi:hypothetical protein